MSNFRGLKNLYDESFENLHLYTGDDTHPTEVSHYGNKKMIECLLKLDAKFGKALAEGEFDTVDPETEKKIPPKIRKIYVNDISLPWGGMFKCYGNMKNDGHSNHKWGNCVDISFNPKWGINSKQKFWLKRVGKETFGIIVDKYDDHYHFRVPGNG